MKFFLASGTLQLLGITSVPLVENVTLFKLDQLRVSLSSLKRSWCSGRPLSSKVKK